MLKAFREYTKQEIFDETAAHLFRQGERSIGHVEEGLTCLYRGPNNTKCAVGYWIRDKDYRKKMESKDAQTLAQAVACNPSVRFIEKHVSLFLDLQYIHDSVDAWCSTKKMQRALRCVADQYGLDMSNVDKMKFADR